jgi:hypothetical protein
MKNNIMTKEQQQIIDEAYEKYIFSCREQFEKFREENFDALINYREDTKEGFIKSIKENKHHSTGEKNFSEKWGLKIEERELSDAERLWLCSQKHNIRFSNVDGPTWYNPDNPDRNKLKWMTESQKSLCDYNNIPTKLITITYNDTKLESYE